MLNANRTYEEVKKTILLRKEKDKKRSDAEIMREIETSVEKRPKAGVSDYLQVGSKVVIGGGLGLLGGVAAIAVAASVGEVIVAGVVTKIAGVVGGAIGLSLGVHSYTKKVEKLQ